MNGTNDAIYDGTPMTGWTSTEEPCSGDGISPWWILAAVAVALLLVGGKDQKQEHSTHA